MCQIERSQNVNLEGFAGGMHLHLFAMSQIFTLEFTYKLLE